MNENNITFGTAVRTIVLLLALVNQVLTATGHNAIDISSEDINTLIATAVTIGAALVSWWKNNSFTKAAMAGDAYMNELKKSMNKAEECYD